MVGQADPGGARGRLLEWLLERAPFGVTWLTEGGDVELNAEAARIAGLTVRRMPLSTWVRTIRLVDRAGNEVMDVDRRPMTRAFAGEHLPRTRMEVVRDDGSRLDVSIEAFPWNDEEAGTRGAIVLVEDVSWAQESERAAAQWLGAMGHELNGSLQHVFGAFSAAQLYLGRDAAKVIHHLQAAQRQALLMRRLVRDFVDAARLGAGAFECRRESFPIGSLLRDMAEAAETTDARHRVVVQADDEVWVVGDVDRVRQILTNLFSNAAKYSVPGLLTLGAEVRQGRVVVFLRDEGPGIPPEEHERLFQKFGRLPSREDGSGMGLWIARELAHRMGGDVWVQSADGGPTTFFVALPAVQTRTRGEQASDQG